MLVNQDYHFISWNKVSKEHCAFEEEEEEEGGSEEAL